jgi:histone-lysine N-methyltransferase SETMAR
VLYDNARPHTAEEPTKLSDKFDWEALQHSPYSSELSPSSCHLFSEIKEFLRGKRMTIDIEVKEAVTD